MPTLAEELAKLNTGLQSGGGSSGGGTTVNVDTSGIGAMFGNFLGGLFGKKTTTPDYNTETGAGQPAPASSGLPSWLLPVGLVGAAAAAFLILRKKKG